ncbi:hypothetical protein LVW35_27875 [Pseudomonas sp. HN11]|uniref:hypothetical protein n=1 Tax=Pseudomonas sp. HN11 TaxID=1344094 RepID=UPI001F3EC4FB|nr:hypothetical protein [Pseudomonas sp. HN11]UII71402.1 hypothetical protein LVW35_27875 [Pseudomonas sp. HN11]
MNIHTIAPEHASDKAIRCAHCWDHEATHIELTSTGEHDPDEHLVLCSKCAYLAGLMSCAGCETGRKVTVMSFHLFGDLIPIYAPGELDEGGHCAWHIGSSIQTEVVEFIPRTRSG